MYDKEYFKKFQKIVTIENLRKKDEEFSKYCEEILNQIFHPQNTIHDLIYCIINDLNIHTKCLICGKQLSLKSIRKNRKYCSHNCAYKDKNIRERIKQTNIQKYGVQSPLQLQENKQKLQQLRATKQYHQKWKQKYTQTNLEKYGVENPSQSQEIKRKREQTCFQKYGVKTNLLNEENITKMKQTNLEKYGCQYQICSKQTQNKIKQTFQKKYGVQSIFSLEEVQEKIKQTNLEKYGVENPSQLEQIKNKRKQTMVEKYGCEYPFQNQELKNKILQPRYDIIKKRIKSWEKYVIPNFDIEKFNGWKDNVYEWKCVKCGLIFEQKYKQTYITNDDVLIPRCPKCYPWNDGKSIEQKVFLSFIKQIYKDQIIENDRQLIKPYQLDIILPKLHLAIEYDGIYWHSDKIKDSNYHLMKTKLCEEKGYRLIHIFEYEWFNKPQIIKAKLKSIICNNQKAIYARKCQIKQIEANESNQFLNKNHIQGEDHSSIKLGLYYQNELVALMTFCKPRFNKKYQWQLSRYATSKRVIGGASKLLKYFRDHYTGSIITYCDRRFSTGNMYQKIGFKLDHISKPNYWWTKGNFLLSRYECQKHKLKKLLGEQNFNKDLSENQNMINNGYSRIYDCGNLVYIY